EGRIGSVLGRNTVFTVNPLIDDHARGDLVQGLREVTDPHFDLRGSGTTGGEDGDRKHTNTEQHGRSSWMFTRSGVHSADRTPAELFDQARLRDRFNRPGGFALDLIAESPNHIAAEIEDGQIVVASRARDRNANLLTKRTAGHHQDPVGQKTGFVSIMRDEDDRLAHLLPYRQEIRVDALRSDLIEPREWFIHQEDAGLHAQGPHKG